MHVAEPPRELRWRVRQPLALLAALAAVTAAPWLTAASAAPGSRARPATASPTVRVARIADTRQGTAVATHPGEDALYLTTQVGRVYRIAGVGGTEDRKSTRLNSSH